MSTQYKHGNEIPLDALCNRLNEIAHIVTKGKAGELTMRVPAEVDYDADLVLSEAARRLRQMDRLLPNNKPIFDE